MVAAKSSRERSAEYRERKRSEGVKEVLIRLTPEATNALENITERTGEGRSEAVCRAVVKLDREEGADGDI